MTDGAVEDLLEDDKVLEKRFDEKEKRLIAIQREIEVLKETLEKSQRFKAELVQGISVLSQKLGVEAPTADGLSQTLQLCDQKVKELLNQKARLGTAIRGRVGGVNPSISDQESNIRVKLPGDERKSSSRYGGGGGISGSVSGSDSHHAPTSSVISSVRGGISGDGGS